MAPFWAQANAAAAAIKNRQRNAVAKLEPIALRNKLESFTISSTNYTFYIRLIYIVLNPKVREKLYRIYPALLGTMVTTVPSQLSRWNLKSIPKESFNEHGRAGLARIASGGVGAHLQNSTHVDADRGEDPPRPNAAAKPLVEYRFIRECTRFDDVVDPISR